MAKTKISTKIVVQYNGHSFRKNGDLDLNFKVDYSEIVNVLSLMRMLNQNIDIQVKLGGGKPEALGTFQIKNINIDRDGESKIKFNSETTSINPDKLIDLTEPDTLILLRAQALVESEDFEEGEDDE